MKSGTSDSWYPQGCPDLYRDYFTLFLYILLSEFNYSLVRIAIIIIIISSSSSSSSSIIEIIIFETSSLIILLNYCMDHQTCP